MEALDLNADERILMNVFEQIDKESEENKMKNKYKKMSRFSRVAAAGIAIALVGTTTVVLAANLSKIRGDKEGQYASKVAVSVESEYSLPEEMYETEGTFTVIPDGMELYGNWKLHSSIEDNGTFITPVSMILDKEIEEDLVLPFSKETKELKINDHDALRVSCNDGRTIYFVMYPEVYRIVEFYVGPDVGEEVALKAMEGYELKLTDEKIDIEELDRLYTWSEYVEEQNQIVSGEGDLVDVVEAPSASINEDKVLNIGDEIEYGCDEYKGISAKVTDVSFYDDLSAIEEESEMPSDWKDAVGEDGKFKKNVIEYIKSGDGINSLDEVIGTKEVNRKLVYATIEFTNNSDKTIEDVYYFISLKSIIEKDNGYELKYYYDRSSEFPEEADACRNSDGSFLDIYEMLYHDCERTNYKNYINFIEPGETVQLHVAYMVNEDVLPTLALHIDDCTEENNDRVVDIRQK